MFTREVLDSAFHRISRQGFLNPISPALGEICKQEVGKEAQASERDLLIAMLEDNRTLWSSELAQSFNRKLPGEFALIQLFEGMVRLFDDRETMRGRLLLFFEFAGHHDPILTNLMRDVQQDMQAGLVAILNAGIQSGHFRSVDVDTLAIIVNGACRGIGYQWVLDSSSLDLVTVFRELENMLVRTVGSNE